MNSRRGVLSFLGFGAAAAGAAVIAAKPVMAKAPTPYQPSFVRGEIREVFSHFVPVCSGGAHTHSLSAAGASHTHSFSSTGGTYASAAATKQMIFDGSEFVQLDSGRGQAVVQSMVQHGKG